MDPQPAWLGDDVSTQVVETTIPGVYNARIINGKVLKVHNTLGVPPTFDLHVEIGRHRNQPTIWQIIRVIEDYDNPAAQGEIAYHHKQHMFGAGDELPVDRKQITSFTARVIDGTAFTVQLYGGAFPADPFVAVVDSQILDLSPYKITDYGAKYVAVEADSTGAISFHSGSRVESIFLLTKSYIPATPQGKFLIFYALMYEGQTLADKDIIVPMPLGGVSKSSGTETHEAAAGTPDNVDEFSFWHLGTLELWKITWANFKALLKTYFDTIYSALGHTHTIFNDSEGDPADVSASAAADGTSAFAARRNHVHFYSQVSPLFASDLSDPLVPLENSAGDDWVYP